MIGLFIAGPTAVGKTEIAVAVAERCGGEIISVDAFQIYAGLPLLTAKPSPEMLARVPHHLVGEIPLNEECDAARFATLARERAEDISSRGKLPLFVGGSGFYFRALIHGLPELPAADATLREELEALSTGELQRRLGGLDAIGFAEIDRNNRRRLIRAIEVCVLTGQPFSSFRPQKSNSGKQSGILLVRDREDLRERIDRRVEEMFTQGVVAEVAAAGALSATASQMIGFREIGGLLRGEMTKRQCIEQIQIATRQYAKRQLTWFRSEPMFEVLNLSAHPQSDFAIGFLARRGARSSSDV
ncbi:MAG: tRNA (adenosine(37)-N6)-dimethylallyltransferase MiaA [Verrucomicrobiota bacterium]|nr:tRNA (adenosine(37)-N6)-dimethylallyltransferase MiaA [Verrucomicrobiota bacterium]